MAGEDDEYETNKEGIKNDVSAPMYSGKVADFDTELSKMINSLEVAGLDIANRDNEIALLKAQSSERDVLLKKLVDDVERGKESERQMIDSLAEQTNQLSQTKILLEEAKLKISSLKEELRKSENGPNSSSTVGDQTCAHCDAGEGWKTELESTRENLEHGHESAEDSSKLTVANLLEEISVVKNELNLATEAEKNSKKAMDDLALALKEVATDCSQAKEKLVTAETQLEAAKLEANEFKEKLEATEQNYKTLLQEARKEAELQKNTSERLRIEAEESLMAWNGKESVFVSCIKRGEDEKKSLLDENNRLLEALMSAENQSKKAKEENHKLRDILKQAINEANVAKEAAGIARAENSQLKDTLHDKEEELKLVLEENERIRAWEAAANDNVKDLKRLLSETTQANESRASEKEKEKNKVFSRQNSSAKEQSKRLSHQNSMQRDQELEKKNDKKEDKKEVREDKEDKKIGKTCSFSLKELKLPNKHKDTTTDDETKAATNSSTQQQESTDNSEECSPGSDSDLFRGSIFDVAETPGAAKTHHRKKSSCSFMEDGESIMNPEDLENYQVDECSETDKSSRKKKAFIRRFGDLLVRRKSFHKKEPSSDQQEKQQQQQQQQQQLPSPQPQTQTPPPEQ